MYSLQCQRLHDCARGYSVSLQNMLLLRKPGNEATAYHGIQYCMNVYGLCAFSTSQSS